MPLWWLPVAPATSCWSHRPTLEISSSSTTKVSLSRPRRASSPSVTPSQRPLLPSVVSSWRPPLGGGRGPPRQHAGAAAGGGAPPPHAQRRGAGARGRGGDAPEVGRPAVAPADLGVAGEHAP